MRVAPSSVKTWDLAFRIRGTAKMRRLSLGRTTDVSLEQARERANELTSAARQGRDLIAEEGETRDAATSQITVGGLIDLYLRRQVARPSAHRRRDREGPKARPRPDRSAVCRRHLKARDIRELLDAIADRGCMREAEKRRQMVGAMSRWALSQDIVEADRTAGLKAYDPGTPRDRVLTVEEIELVWKWLESDALSLEAADILRLQLLIGARCGEISGICAEEIDRNRWLWCLPARRSKNEQPRVTPILGTARELLEPRLDGAEKGPLFVLENGTVLTFVACRPFSVDARKQATGRQIQ